MQQAYWRCGRLDDQVPAERISPLRRVRDSRGFRPALTAPCTVTIASRQRLWPLTSKASRCRVLAEVEALQEMLLLHSAAQPLASAVLTARLAASGDLVAQTLSALASKAPADVWQTLQAEAAKTHGRWAELCARCMHAAFERNFDSPFQDWAAAVTAHIHSSAHVPVPTFRKLPIEAQLEFVGPVELDGAEVAEVRQVVADALGVELDSLLENAEGLEEALKQRRASLRAKHAAARVLQSRIPEYLRYRQAKRQKDEERRRQLAWAAQCWAIAARAELPGARAAARTSAAAAQARERAAAAAEADSRPGTADAAAESDAGAQGDAAEALATEARDKLCSVLQCIARSAQLAARCGSWLQVVNAVLHAWNAIRRMCDDDQALFKHAAGSAEWVLVSPEPSETDPPPETQPEVEVGADGESSPAAEGSGEGEVAPQGRWTCTAAPQNVPRLLRAALEPLLTLTAAIKSGDVIMPTAVGPIASEDAAKFDGFPKKRPRTPGAPQSVSYAGSVLSLGSDKPGSPWFLEERQLDFDQLTQVVLAGATALLAGGRPAAALALGEQWAMLTDGAFDEMVMPLCLQAAPRVGVDAQPFAAALALVVRDKRAALCTLETVRHAAHALGVQSVLAAAPAPKLRKARSVKPGQSGGGSGARSRAASSVRSGLSGGTLSENRLMVRVPLAPQAQPLYMNPYGCT